MTDDPVAHKERQREMWALGDYPTVARHFEAAAAELVGACAIAPDDRVLDVGAGTGNVALAAVAAGAEVVASDLTPALIELGRARTQTAGAAVQWVEADAEDLPFADASFDAVTSAFGLIFAPRPEVAIAEAFGVVRPGGVVGLTAWTPEGASGRLRWVFPSLPGAREEIESSVGAIVAARALLEPQGYVAMIDDLEALVRELNVATDGSVAYDSEYLLIVARRPG